jgi:hypothetical protein
MHFVSETLPHRVRASAAIVDTIKGERHAADPNRPAASHAKSRSSNPDRKKQTEALS